MRLDARTRKSGCVCIYIYIEEARIEIITRRAFDLEKRSVIYLEIIYFDCTLTQFFVFYNFLPLASTSVHVYLHVLSWLILNEILQIIFLEVFKR